MSSNTPTGPNDSPDHPSEGDSPEYLGSGTPVDVDAGSGPAKNWPVLGAVAVGVAAMVGLGGWGAFALLSGGGAQPADALPSTAVAYVSVDLDPSASQKIEAFQILKKFPGIDKALDISSTDDLRRVLFEKVQEQGSCKNLDYDSDIKPWIGERVALAAVPDGEPGADAPVLALQVADQDAAADGIRALARCGEAGDDFGFAFSDDYVLITDSTKRAEAIAAGVAKGSLADDDGFQAWTSKVGDPGIVTMYAAAGAPAYFADVQGGPEQAQMMAPSKVKSLSKDFKGMAATVRFEDGAVEAEVAGQGAPAGIIAAGADSGPQITELPASTAAALSVALPDGWLDTMLESMSPVAGMSPDEMLAEAEAETGLDLPADLETLLGDGVSLSVDGSLDLDAMTDSEDPAVLPIGLRVSGDPDQILSVFEKVKSAVGPEGDTLIGAGGDGVVAFGLNPDYVQTLLDDGSLGDQESFRRVLPDADRASGVLYVNFDAGDGWAERLARFIDGFAADAFADEFPDEFSDAPPDAPDVAFGENVGENVAPLDALGISTWVDGDVQRGRFRLTTD